MTEIEQVRDENYAAIRGRHCCFIVESDAGYEVHRWTPTSIYPAIAYPTKRLAAARLLQLLELGPVAPQTHPESVRIDVVDHADRCPVCDWPLAASVQDGCVPGNCSYRPHEGTPEYTRIEQRRRELARRIETEGGDAS